tara:strand:+ start:405 stop:1307 length:903 start_codon:yes stop_codon:yes gene_type:complete
MNESLTIVSGGDTKYFELLKDLLFSLKNLEIKDNLDIYFLDGGLQESEKVYFSSFGVNVIDPGWPNKLSKIKAGKKNHLKVELAKVHLDKLIPNSQNIIWIDADAWVQNVNAIEIIKSVIIKKKLAIVSQASRLQERHMSLKKVFGPLYILKNILYKNATKANLKKEIINSMVARPTLNAGVFGISSDSPHWKRLRYWQKIFLNNPRVRIFTTTQLALGIISYYEKLPFEALPDICNYMGPYRWSKKLNLFIDLYAPYHPVGIIHLVSQEQMRIDKEHKIDVYDEEDKIIQMSLRYQKSQ